MVCALSLSPKVLNHDLTLATDEQVVNISPIMAAFNFIIIAFCVCFCHFSGSHVDSERANYFVNHPLNDEAAAAIIISTKFAQGGLPLLCSCFLLLFIPASVIIRL
jgi:hypothetical protein